MVSPCKAHFQKTQAATQTSDAQSEVYADASQYELMLMQLANHKRQLKDIQSIQRKIEVKATLLPEYEAYIEGVLEANTGVQDDVLMTILLWHMETGSYDQAAIIANYAITHGLNTPDGHKRQTATLVAEEFAEAVLKNGPDITQGQLSAISDLTAESDMPDEVRAKLHKAIGVTHAEAGQLEEAKVHLQTAFSLHDKSGVKKLLEKLERQLKAKDEGAETVQETAPG